jgi:hypothetical protein
MNKFKVGDIVKADIPHSSHFVISKIDLVYNEDGSKNRMVYALATKKGQYAFHASENHLTKVESKNE